MTSHVFHTTTTCFSLQLKVVLFLFGPEYHQIVAQQCAIILQTSPAHGQKRLSYGVSSGGPISAIARPEGERSVRLPHSTPYAFGKPAGGLVIAAFHPYRPLIQPLTRTSPPTLSCDVFTLPPIARFSCGFTTVLQECLLFSDIPPNLFSFWIPFHKTSTSSNPMSDDQ